jgi:hypothetical protein
VNRSHYPPRYLIATVTKATAKPMSSFGLRAALSATCGAVAGTGIIISFLVDVRVHADLRAHARAAVGGGFAGTVVV